MSTINIRAVCAAVLCMTGFAELPAAVPAQEQTGIRAVEASEASHPYSHWQCARLPIKTRMLGRVMEVVVAGESRILTRAMSASGARYVAPGDPDTEFWGKGGVASVSWSGKALPACAQAGAVVTPFRASGNEPFWAIDHDGWRLSLSRPGQPVREFEIQEQAAREGGLTLRATGGGDTLRLDLAEGICQDTMSGMLRPYSATVTMDDKTMQGCGGDPARLLQGVRWMLKSVGGEAISVPAWVEFLPDDRLAGSNGCNRLIGSYAISGEGLSFSQLGSTRMACQPEVMAQSGKVEQYLSEVRGFSFDGQGALVLDTGRGNIVGIQASPEDKPAR